MLRSEVQVRNIKEKKLIGLNMEMSLRDNKTAELWRAFMALKNKINKSVSDDLISLQVYEPNYFLRFDPSAPFVKWALKEVSDHEHLPAGMSAFIIPEGLYAVFYYKGLSTDAAIYNYIFSEWLPASAYALANRPHFEVLGAGYKNNDPDSEEEIWIPINKKSTNDGNN